VAQARHGIQVCARRLNPLSQDGVGAHQAYERVG
jgi:hypothetical protein